MSNDLSQVRARAHTQRRVTARRAGVLPSRRETDAPSRQGFADLRSAHRGDVGGAEELLRITRQMSKAAADVRDYADKAFAANEARNRQQGAVDVTNDEVDETLLATSRGYFEAVAQGRAARAWYEGLPSVRQDVDQLINRQTSADLAERRREIDAALEESFARFALDPETGKLRNFGTARANVWVADQMRETRATLTQQAYQAAEAKLRKESINNAAGVLIGQLKEGQEPDFGKLYGLLADGADYREATDEFHKAVQSFVVGNPHEGRAVVRKLLAVAGDDKPQAPAEPGQTPRFALTASQRLSYQRLLVETDERIEEQEKKERKARYEAAQERFNERFAQGKPPSVDEIREAERNDEIPASMALTMIEAIESEARQRRAEARAAAAEARAAAAEARAEYRDRVELGVSTLAVRWRVGLGPRDYDSFASEISRLQRSGQLGTGAQAASNIGTLDAAWRTGRSAVQSSPQYRTYALALEKTLTNPVGALRGMDLTRKVAALSRFETLVLRERVSPSDAYHRVLKEHGPIPATRLEAVTEARKAMEARRNQR